MGKIKKIFRKVNEKNHRKNLENKKEKLEI